MSESDEAAAALTASVHKRLAATGLLPTLKAQLRAAVFKALDEGGDVPRTDRRCLNETLAATNGKAALALMLDLCEMCGLAFSLDTLRQEIGSEALADLPSREKLAQSYSLEASDAYPLLPLLVSAAANSRRGSVQTSGGTVAAVTPDLLRAARRSFQKYDKDGSGAIDRDELRELLRDLFPDLQGPMLERYVTEELRAYDRDLSATIDFDEYMALYLRLIRDHNPEVARRRSSILNAVRGPPLRGHDDATGFEQVGLPVPAETGHAAASAPVPVSVSAARTPPVAAAAARVADTHPAPRSRDAPLGQAVLPKAEPVATSARSDSPGEAEPLSGSGNAPAALSGTFLTEELDDEEDQRRLAEIDRRLEEIKAQRALNKATLEGSEAGTSDGDRTPTGSVRDGRSGHTSVDAADYVDDFESSARTASAAEEIEEEEILSEIQSDLSMLSGAGSIGGGGAGDTTSDRSLASEAVGRGLDFYEPLA